MKLSNLALSVNGFSTTQLLLRKNSCAVSPSSNKVFFNLRDNKNIPSLIASNQISSKPLHCYHSQYQSLGGKKLSKDIVNMVVQQVTTPKRYHLDKYSQYLLFSDITKQVRALKIKHSKEIWFLSSIITQCEFGFSVNYSHWLLTDVLNKVFTK